MDVILYFGRQRPSNNIQLRRDIDSQTTFETLLGFKDISPFTKTMALTRLRVQSRQCLSVRTHGIKILGNLQRTEHTLMIRFVRFNIAALSRVASSICERPHCQCGIEKIQRLFNEIVC